MTGPFLFGKYRDKMLITNDAGRYAFLTSDEFNAFCHGQALQDTEKQNELIEKGFILNGSIEEYIRESSNAVRENHGYLFDGTSLFILVMTNACNNRCVYCQANGGGKVQWMQKTTIDQIIRRIAEVSSRSITIEFQGGEPLLNYPMIAYCIEQAEIHLKHKNIQFALVSNFICLTEEMADFFAAHNISISTSLDGPEKLHNRNRPSNVTNSSYDAVLKGKALLEGKGLTVSAIQTTTAYSLQQPEEIVDTYVALGFNQIFLRPLTRLGVAATVWDKIGYDPSEFVAFYQRGLKHILDLNRTGVKLVEAHAAYFLSKLIRGRGQNYMELRSPCGAGIGQMAFTPNGNVYTCDEGRMIADMGDEAFCMGNVFTHSMDDMLDSDCCKAVCSASLLETLPGCCDCVYQPYCGVCPVINYALNHHVACVSWEKCAVYKGILDTLFSYLYEDDPETIKIFYEWSVC